MSENLDHISPKAMEDAVNEAWRLLATAIELRDNLGVSAEVKRVARALCHSNGNNSDDYVIVKPRARFGLEAVTLYTGNVMLAWRDYVEMAKIVITNLDAAREEESLRLKQHEEAVAAVETAGVGFSNMNNGEDVKFVAIDPSNPNRVTDSLSHSDLAAMVEFLATIFDEGPDGDSAVCRQTGKEFFTVKMGYKGDGKQSPEVIRKWLIRWATLEIVGKAPMVDGGTIYWRKRPIIELERGVLKIYARVAFGP